MNEKSSPQYAQVEQPFGCDPPIVYCPICGNATMAIGEEGGEVTPCLHLAFIYVGEVGEFEYQSEDFRKEIEKVNIEDLSSETFKQLLEKAGYGNKMLAIEITHGGIACGPVSFTDVYGFDYNSLRGTDKSKQGAPSDG